MYYDVHVYVHVNGSHSFWVSGQSVFWSRCSSIGGSISESRNSLQYIIAFSFLLVKSRGENNGMWSANGFLDDSCSSSLSDMPAASIHKYDSL